MEPVAAGDDVALDGLARSIEDEADRWTIGLHVVELYVAHLEQDRMPGCEPKRDQVLDDLLLAVHRDPASAGELTEVDAVIAATEAQSNAVMHQALAAHPRSRADGIEQVSTSVLEHAGANPVLHVRPRPRLDDDRLDAFQTEQMRQHQSGGTRPDDRHLGAHAATAA